LIVLPQDTFFQDTKYGGSLRKNMTSKKIIRLCHIKHFFKADFTENLTSLSKFYNDLLKKKFFDAFKIYIVYWKYS
jgi:hypothetical protein